MSSGENKVKLKWFIPAVVRGLLAGWIVICLNTLSKLPFANTTLSQLWALLIPMACGFGMLCIAGMGAIFIEEIGRARNKVSTSVTEPVEP